MALFATDPLESGLKCHQAGDFEQAKLHYLQSVSLNPNRAESHYLLGTLHWQVGNLHDAESTLAKALKLNPNYAEALNSLALVRRDDKKPIAAEALLIRALELNPQYHDARFNLALILEDLTRFDDAVNHWRLLRSSDVQPTVIQTHLAYCLFHTQQLEQALLTVEQLLAQDPKSADGWNLKSAILKSQKRFGDALLAVSKALELNDKLPDAWLNATILLGLQQRYDEAAKAGDVAVRIAPNNPSAHHALGMILHQLERHDAARASFHQAVKLAPHSAEFWSHLGTSCFLTQDFNTALTAYQTAADLAPDEPRSFINLGAIHDQLGQLDQARQAYDRLLLLIDRCAGQSTQERMNPHLWRVRRSLICPAVFADHKEMLAWREHLQQALMALRDSSEAISLQELFEADYRPVFNAQFHGLDERPLRELFAHSIARHVNAESSRIIANSAIEPTATNSMSLPRIGFVCSDGHEVSFVRSLGQFFAHFDHQQAHYAVVCSEHGRSKLKQLGLTNHVEYDVVSTDLAPMLTQLASKQYDLLYYWEIGTCVQNYLPAFVRLAPVQVTSWGIQVTSGCHHIDYYLSSRWFEPPNADEHYSEKLILLDTLLTSQPHPVPISKLAPREQFGITNDAHVYLCPQHLGKFHPDFDAYLKEILTRDTDGVLVVTKGKRPMEVSALQQRWQQTLGEQAAQVIWVDNQSGDNYASLITHADVALDPIHFGGVNTTYDALNRDCPVITHPQEFQRGRYTAGVLSYLGLDDLIADSRSQYVDKAVAIACSRILRQVVSSKINIARHVLYDNPQPARELEQILLDLIRNPRFG